MFGRRLGIKLIVAYLCLKALVIILAVVVGYLNPELQPEMNELISHVIPTIHSYHIDNYVLIYAPLFGILYIVLGFGIWFLKKWAWTIIVVDLSWAFGRAAIGLGMLIVTDRKTLQSLVLPPDLAVNIIISLFVLVYLINPDIKRTFGMRE
jgi:hypothetical protein